MTMLKIIYDGDKITLNPFDKDDSVMVELNEFLQGCLRVYRKTFEIDIKIDYDAKEIEAASSESIRRYLGRITDEPDMDLVLLLQDIFNEEEIVIPEETYILGRRYSDDL